MPRPIPSRQCSPHSRRRRAARAWWRAARTCCPISSTADVVVSLRRVAELHGIAELPDGSLRLGATTLLEEVASHPAVRGRFAGLAQAASLVAGPHHRRMGTLGGNVCLNTRCVYINQTHFWRSALGYCLKKDGDVCHVVKGGRRCVAAASNDTAPPLLAFDARLLIARRDPATGAVQRRELPLSAFFVKDGVHNNTLGPDELLLAVLVPPAQPGLRSAYAKLRPRDSIDFPRLGVAAAFQLRDAHGHGVAPGGHVPAGAAAGATVHDLRLVVTALAAVPQVLRDVRELAEGRAPGEPLWEELAAAAFKQCHPLSNIDGDPAWRREMVPVFVKRALRAAARHPQ
jgi:4-hydroxybenzoyl-CoA reductase subunit beta